MDVIADARARGACILVSTHLRELADPGLHRRDSSCAAGRGSRPSTPPRWRGRRGPVPTGLSSTERADRAGVRLARPGRRPPGAPSPTSATCSASAPRPSVVAGRCRRRSRSWAHHARRRARCRRCSRRPRGRPRTRRAPADADDVRGVLRPDRRLGGRRPAAGASCSPATRAVAFPVSPTTDHLGALLLAPLNIAWLLQAWALLGGAAYALGPADCVPGHGRDRALARRLHRDRPGRRLDHGGDPARPYGRHRGPLDRGRLRRWRSASCSVTGRLTDVLDNLPTLWLVAARDPTASASAWLADRRSSWSCIVVAVVLGAVPAHLAARRPPRDEARLESGQLRSRAGCSRTVRRAPRPHRPRVGVALGADAPRHHRPRRRSRPGRDLRQPDVGDR